MTARYFPGAEAFISGTKATEHARPVAWQPPGSAPLLLRRNRLDRKPSGQPAVETALEVGRAVEAEITQGRRRDARAVAVGADEDDPATPIGERRVVEAGGRVEPPVQHGERDMDRAGDDAAGRAGLGATRVDDHRTR